MTESSFEFLCREHSELITAAEAILTAASAPSRPAMSDLSRLRSRLSSLLKAHLESEEMFIFAPLADKGGADAIPGAGAILHEIRTGRAAYSTQVQHWYSRTIEADWDGYVASLVPLIDGLKRIAAREETELYRPALSLIGDATPRSLRVRSTLIERGAANRA